MEALFIFVGAVFILAISICLISFCWCYILDKQIEFWYVKNKKEFIHLIQEYKNWASENPYTFILLENLLNLYVKGHALELYQAREKARKALIKDRELKQELIKPEG